MRDLVVFSTEGQEPVAPDLEFRLPADHPRYPNRAGERLTTAYSDALVWALALASLPGAELPVRVVLQPKGGAR